MSRTKKRHITVIFSVATLLLVNILFFSLFIDGEYANFFLLGDNLENRASLITLDIAIAEEEKLMGKTLIFRSTDEKVVEKEITSLEMDIELVKGKYTLEMPKVEGYINRKLSFEVAENGGTIFYEYEYDWNNDMILRFDSSLSESFFELRLSEGGTKGRFVLYPEDNDDLTVEIRDNKGNLVKGSYVVDLEDGYRLSVRGRGISRVYSYLNGRELEEFRSSDYEVSYFVRDGVLVKDGMDSIVVQSKMDSVLRDYLLKMLDEYKTNVGKAELGNKNVNVEVKKKIIRAYESLELGDKSKYDGLIDKIKRGGFPTINIIGKLEYKVKETIDLYALISVEDAEDGKIKVNEQTTKVETTLDSKKAGVYKVTYKVRDSDGNIGERSINVKIVEQKKLQPIIKPNKNETGPKVEEENNVPDKIQKKYAKSEVDTELEVRAIDGKKSTRPVIYLIILSILIVIVLSCYEFRRRKNKS